MAEKRKLPDYNWVYIIEEFAGRYSAHIATNNVKTIDPAIDYSYAELPVKIVFYRRFADMASASAYLMAFNRLSMRSIYNLMHRCNPASEDVSLKLNGEISSFLK